MNDIVVENDGTVRKSNGEIVQFKYGGDGWDANHLVRIFLTDLDLNADEFSKKYLEHSWKSYQDSLCNKEIKNVWKKECDEETRVIKKLHGFLQKHKRSLLQNFAEKSADIIFVPVNIEEELYALEHSYGHVRFQKKTDLTIQYLHKRVYETIQELREINEEEESTEYFLMRNLCCKEIIVKRHLTCEMLDILLQIIIKRYRIAKVEANEMVGSLAAESFGEPCTQMTLNT